MRKLIFKVDQSYYLFIWFFAIFSTCFIFKWSIKNAHKKQKKFTNKTLSVIEDIVKDSFNDKY